MINCYDDVDGVYIAQTDHRFDPPPREASGWDGVWHPLEIGGAFPGWWSQEMIDSLNRIGNELVSPRWLTSWEEGAPEQVAPALSIAGGSSWPVLTGVEYDNPVNWQWWKLAALKADLAATNPEGFIWIDDDIGSNPDALAWLSSLDVPHLVIVPAARIGVTRSHIEEIEAFIGEFSTPVRTHG